MGTVVVPPGITCNDHLIEVHDGGIEDWLPFSEVRTYTNAFIVQKGKILLGYKKRGFGQGLWNGFGGKLSPGESSLQAAERELEEEAGIKARLRKCGLLFFIDENVAWAFHIDMYIAETFSGEITESDEMRPQWFATQPADASTHSEIAKLPQIPFTQMWADDVYWMPLLLSHTPFIGRFDFGKDGTLQKWWLAKVERSS